ncbi:MULTISPECIES: S8 family serine peptidase [unclassified Micromonospora]|uniref:S8 family serine peptidase n=1 Tax=unclassified Micromonospora TaxID=2617518 RepID=UPI00112C45CB|nr:MULTISPECIES: S8 family serine peptidase [unclassified Micromonospora]MCK1810087.1 S8 family serine peptidase [Micromonospora sp. R42106]MCK1835240.1 S8 family serine peptidase [Micromonospora sp. R42003]MCK1847153.1 S8 family serine peptidase [Micromonospora sp. R42004]MCM1016760.1 S8 family serine peptidase [Micromonospora sp. XM-20-01]
MTMLTGPPFAPVPPPPPRETGPWPVVAAVLTGFWVVLVTVPGQVGGWLVEQVMLVMGLDRAVAVWPVVAVVTVLLAGAPSLALALAPRSPALRATGRAWTAAVVALGATTLLRTVPPVHHEAYLAALAVTAAVLAFVAARLARVRPPVAVDAVPEGRFGTVPLLAVAAGLASLLPWAWVGALGGALETVLAGLAAAALGTLAGALLGARFWAAFGPGPARLVLVGGLVAGVALTPLAAAAGQSGVQLPALFLLPPLGFVLAALEAAARQSGRPAGPAPVRWLIGLALLGPLAFTDPDEITLLLATTRDTPFWVAVGTGVAFAVAVLLALGYGVLLARSRARAPRRGPAALAAAALLVAVAVVYVVPGQPGLHGERLLVVLREQADLTGLPAGTPGRAGRDARATEVYRRLVATADRTQGDLRRTLTDMRLKPTPYYLVNAIETDGGPAVRAWLSGRPEVARVLVSQRLRPLPALAPTARGDAPAPTGPAWNISLIGADRVWSELGVTGSGVVVGSSDSGVDGRHPALAGGFRGGDDSWYDPWEDRRAPADRGGHGTHTLGSAVGRDGIGVAPGASWVGCVNLDRNLGSPARYLDCLQFMLAPFPPGGNPLTDGRPARAPDVLTNSWGCPPLEGCDPGALRPATAALTAAGILVVAAAGNTGPSCGSIVDPPAPYPDVLTVGAVDRQRRVTDFSSRGPAPDGVAKPDLVAPGAAVLSAMPGGGYATLDGTSMATPQVAGVVALMWSANPALVGDLERTRAILRDTAQPVPQPAEACGGPRDVSGAGLVDAYAAVRAARAAATG